MYKACIKTASELQYCGSCFAIQQVYSSSSQHTACMWIGILYTQSLVCLCPSDSQLASDTLQWLPPHVQTTPPKGGEASQNVN